MDKNKDGKLNFDEFQSGITAVHRFFLANQTAGPATFNRPVAAPFAQAPRQPAVVRQARVDGERRPGPEARLTGFGGPRGQGPGPMTAMPKARDRKGRDRSSKGVVKAVGRSSSKVRRWGRAADRKCKGVVKAVGRSSSKVRRWGKAADRKCKGVVKAVGRSSSKVRRWVKAVGRKCRAGQGRGAAAFQGPPMGQGRGPQMQGRGQGRGPQQFQGPPMGKGRGPQMQGRGQGRGPQQFQGPPMGKGRGPQMQGRGQGRGPQQFQGPPMGKGRGPQMQGRGQGRGPQQFQGPPMGQRPRAANARAWARPWAARPRPAV